MTNIASARKLENFPDRATINRVTSEQAIRRSKSLVKMTAELIARKQAPEPWAQSLTVAPRPFQITREDARRLRENSRQALERSKAARDRHIAFRNRSSTKGPATQPPESNAA